MADNTTSPQEGTSEITGAPLEREDLSHPLIETDETITQEEVMERETNRLMYLRKKDAFLKIRSNERCLFGFSSFIPYLRFDSTFSSVDVELDNNRMREDKKKRVVSRAVMVFVQFLFHTSYGLFFTNVWPFLLKNEPSTSKFEYTMLMVAYPFGQLVFSVLFLDHLPAVWGSYHSGIIMYSLILIAGSVAYGVMGFHTTGQLPRLFYATLVFARFIMGGSLAAALFARSYLSCVTLPNEERSKSYINSHIGETLGFVFGLSLQSIFTVLGESFAPNHRLDMYIIPAIVNVIIGVISIIMMIAFFKYQDYDADEARLLRITDYRENINRGEGATRLDKFGLCIVVSAVFVFQLIPSILETTSTPVAMDFFHWSRSDAVWRVGVFYIALTLFITALFPLHSLLMKVKTQWNLLLIGIGLAIVGSVILMAWPDANVAPTPPSDMAGHLAALYGKISYNINSLGGFVIFVILSCLGYTLVMMATGNLFQKLLGPKYRSLNMMSMSCGGCIARIIGPVIAMLIYEYSDTMTLAIVLVGLYCLIFLVSGFYSNSLVSQHEARTH